MSTKRRCKLQAPIKGGNVGAKLTHLCGFWLDVSLFLNVKKHLTRLLLWKHRSLLWLASTHLRLKILTYFFGGYFSVCISTSDSYPATVHESVSTWSYENLVSKHFVIFLNFPCLIVCLLCCLLISFCLLVLLLGICVEVDVNRITIVPPSLPLFFVSTHNSLFNTSNSYFRLVHA